MNRGTRHVRLDTRAVGISNAPQRQSTEVVDCLDVREVLSVGRQVAIGCHARDTSRLKRLGGAVGVVQPVGVRLYKNKT